MKEYSVYTEQGFFDKLVDLRLVPECLEEDEEMTEMYNLWADELFDTGEVMIHGHIFSLVD